MLTQLQVSRIENGYRVHPFLNFEEDFMDIRINFPGANAPRGTMANVDIVHNGTHFSIGLLKINRTNLVQSKHRTLERLEFHEARRKEWPEATEAALKHLKDRIYIIDRLLDMVYTLALIPVINYDRDVLIRVAGEYIHLQTNYSEIIQLHKFTKFIEATKIVNSFNLGAYFAQLIEEYVSKQLNSNT